MKSLFVTSSALSILNTKSSPSYEDVYGFLGNLFKHTVRVYTSAREVADATGEILQKTNYQKMERFLHLVINHPEGIKLLYEGSDLVPEAARLLRNISKKQNKFAPPSLRHTLSVCLMRKYGIKNILTLDQAYKNFDVIIWPKDSQR
jgi:predicted nucleic acid-binding protein